MQSGSGWKRRVPWKTFISVEGLSIIYLGPAFLHTAEVRVSCELVDLLSVVHFLHGFFKNVLVVLFQYLVLFSESGLFVEMGRDADHDTGCKGC